MEESLTLLHLFLEDGEDFHVLENTLVHIYQSLKVSNFVPFEVIKY